MRIKLIIQYLGTNYSGWQTQAGQDSVQAQLERAVLAVTGKHSCVEGSGRTDAGVHAAALAAHFDADSRIPPENFCLALNAHLPSDIRVLDSCQVDENFHARFSAKRKTYIYNFYVSQISLPLLSSTYAHIKPPFDFTLAQQACKAFVGTHDFKAFMSTGSNKKDTVRTIFDCSLNKNSPPWRGGTECRGGLNGVYTLRITGNGFLYNMVRIIAGTVFEVGAGKIPPEKVADIIAAGNRKQAGQTAPACGLTLESVEY
ncbi:MAG: tRNA pseudouridine(38-40) synthase TruA [Firmicutes bacterium]|nr:tRNA pseudouridine(38-40) synthase TruA [Bacillota bacterium]